MTSARLDVESPEDLRWVPYAKSLLFSARKFLDSSPAIKYRNFARHYQIGDVNIFIRISGVSEYIKIRAGALGDYLVLPIVEQISPPSTTVGSGTFLSGDLKIATDASDFPTALAIKSRVPPFQHEQTARKKYTGATDPSPSVRGYFQGQLIIDAGNSSLNNYAGIFRHEYVDDITGQDSVEFIHGVMASNAAPSSQSGFWYHTAALGDQLLSFSTLPLLANRPALAESMFASRDGRKVVAEEQFEPGNPYGFADWEIIRSIMDIDLGNPGSEVIVSDKDNLNGYPASTFEAQGSGTVSPVIVSDQVVGNTTTDSFQIFNDILTYPISSAFDINSNLINSNIEFEYFRDELRTETVISGEYTIDYKDDHLIECRIIAENGEVILNKPVRTQTSQYGYFQDRNSGTPEDWPTNLTGPLTQEDTESRVIVGYSDTTLPVIIYRLQTESSRLEFTGTVTGESNPRYSSFTQYESRNAKVFARIGTQEILISEVDEPDYNVVNFGLDTLINIFETTLYTAGPNTSQQNFAILEGTDTILPDATYYNRYFQQNRRDVGELTLPGILDPSADEIQFAAQDRTHFIGSLSYVEGQNAGSPVRTQHTFSNNDARLKETIVNHVLQPAEPITGAALNNYEIYFTAIRAI